MDTLNLNKQMLSALMCVKALDMPYREGHQIMKDAGFDNTERFTVSATDFVKQKVDAAIEAATA